jgi:hypothetical protein
MIQTFNRVDDHHLCSLDEFCKAGLECYGVFVSDHCNANNSSIFLPLVLGREHAGTILPPQTSLRAAVSKIEDFKIAPETSLPADREKWMIDICFKRSPETQRVSLHRNS